MYGIGSWRFLFGANMVAMLTRPNDAVTRLGELLLARMKRNSRFALAEVWEGESGFAEPDAELVGHLIRHREELAYWMREVLDEEPYGKRWEQSPETFLRSILAPWLHEKNQFLRLDDLEASQELDALYRRAMEETAHVLSSRADEAKMADGLREVWEAHRRRLVAFTAFHLGEAPRDAVCARYSPLLQMRVLDFSPEALLEPVLDVGCGSDAALVRYLRQRGVEVYGIDRSAPERLDGVVAADWLEFDYGEQRWGTVISHLGFSLHFLRHHLTDGPAAEALALAHARAYVRVLGSLRPGGSFAYTPALPFVEGLLPPSAYRCEGVALPDELVIPALLTAREHTGLDLAQASRVSRAA
jgi:SAM-dependent methyltransferase